MGATSADQEVRFVGVHRLNFVVGQIRQVRGPDERVTAAVQTHLAVDLTIKYKTDFLKIKYKTQIW